MAQDFSRCKMEYTKDAFGKEVLLKDGKFQVMMEWEKPYMCACIDALKPFGDVLEIGFGLGYSAERIQSYHPKSHTIIEYHPEVAKYARAFAEKYPNVRIVEDTWQNALPRLDVFDSIFFDDYPLHSERQMTKMQEDCAQSALLLKEGHELIQEIMAKMPFLAEIKYSDDDLLGLLKSIPLNLPEEAVICVRFLQELAGKGQITQDQLRRLTAEFVQKKRISQEQLDALLKKPVKKTPFDFDQSGDRLFVFLSACLKSHMRKGSRFSCFLSSAVSKFDDPKFFNEIITNPALDYHEEQIDLEVPSNCTYFAGNKALVITVTKMI